MKLTLQLNSFEALSLKNNDPGEKKSAGTENCKKIELLAQQWILLQEALPRLLLSNAQQLTKIVKEGWVDWLGPNLKRIY